MTEKTYPIYKFFARWSEKADTEQYKEYPNWTKGLPDGRIWNSTSFSKMYKEDQDQKELEGWMMDWWEKYCDGDKNKEKELKLFSLKVEFFENETWHLTWFQHETFDIGQTDQEALDSFENFVRRKEELNEKSRWNEDKDAYCLMGAEDRWRWCGAEPNGDVGDKSPAPCRCKHCKEQGLIRIGH